MHIEINENAFKEQTSLIELIEVNIHWIKINNQPIFQQLFKRQ